VATTGVLAIRGAQHLEGDVVPDVALPGHVVEEPGAGCSPRSRQQECGDARCPDGVFETSSPEGHA
jgi:hypothetical protein